MFKITFKDGKTVLTEKPNFIRVHKNGKTFLICGRKEAEGIAYHGQPCLWADGTYCQEIDGGKVFTDLQAENEAINTHLAETDEIAIDLYEAGLAQETVNAEQDEAIIEIYEMMEGNING